MRPGIRLLLCLLCFASLSGCTRLLHPHRITNPPLPAGFKEKQKAERQARKKGMQAAKNEEKTRLKASKKSKDEDSDDTAAAAAPSAAPVATDATAQGQLTTALPEKSTVKYDKNGLMKKPKYKHRRYYKPAPKPFRPFDGIKALFKRKPKRHDNDKPKLQGKDAPALDAAPTPAPVDTGLTP